MSQEKRPKYRDRHSMAHDHDPMRRAGEETVRVAAAIIERDGRVLLARRPAHVHLAHAWEFPGGKVEPGEDLRGCLAREILEELGTTIEIGECWRVVTHRYPEKTVEIHFFRCRLGGGPEPRPLGASELAWADAGELALFEFPAADREIVRELAAILAAGSAPESERERTGRE